MLSLTERDVGVKKKKLHKLFPVCTGSYGGAVEMQSCKLELNMWLQVALWNTQQDGGVEVCLS